MTRLPYLFDRQILHPLHKTLFWLIPAIVKIPHQKSLSIGD